MSGMNCKSVGLRLRRFESCIRHCTWRSTYVLLSSLVLFLLFWQWRTMPAVIWEVTWTPGRIGLYALFWLGWAVALAATFMINHFDLFGLRQV